jgi:general secretion pathway protein A
MLGAYTEDARRVDAGTVRRAAREVRGERSRAAWPRRLARATLLAAVAGGLIGGGFLAANRGYLPRLPGRQQAEAPPAAAPPLAELLAEAARGGHPGLAFASLGHRWGPESERGGTGRGPGCEADGTAGLVCTALAGSWERIRALDLPVLLRMASPAGRPVDLPLVSLGPTTATLELAGRRLTYPQREVEAFWGGPFLVVWKPQTAARRLAPGARGQDVRWLRARLAAAEGGDATADRSDRYDRSLAERVRRFQRAHDIPPDGIAGEETLLHLTRAVREPGTPTLRDARP